MLYVALCLWLSGPVCEIVSPEVAMTFVTQFGQKLRTLRQARGMSQEALAEAAGLHRTHISLIERGRRSVRLETIQSLALALGVRPADLMPSPPGKAK